MVRGLNKKMWVEIRKAGDKKQFGEGEFFFRKGERGLFTRVVK